MIYEPDFSAPIIIGASGMDAILQNIRMIILTFCFSIPLDCAFAHKARPLDSPGPVVSARLTGDLIDAIEKYEPRVKVDGISWHNDGSGAKEGIFRPKIAFHIEKGSL